MGPLLLPRRSFCWTLTCQMLFALTYLLLSFMLLYLSSFIIIYYLHAHCFSCTRPDTLRNKRSRSPTAVFNNYHPRFSLVLNDSIPFKGTCRFIYQRFKHLQSYMPRSGSTEVRLKRRINVRNCFRTNKTHFCGTRPLPLQIQGSVALSSKANVYVNKLAGAQ